MDIGGSAILGPGVSSYLLERCMTTKLMSGSRDCTLECKRARGRKRSKLDRRIRRIEHDLTGVEESLSTDNLANFDCPSASRISKDIKTTTADWLAARRHVNRVMACAVLSYNLTRTIDFELIAQALNQAIHHRKACRR